MARETTLISLCETTLPTIQFYCKSYSSRPNGRWVALQNDPQWVDPMGPCANDVIRQWMRKKKKKNRIHMMNIDSLAIRHGYIMVYQLTIGYLGYRPTSYIGWITSQFSPSRLPGGLERPHRAAACPPNSLKG